MSGRQGFLLCVFPALSAVLSASDDKTFAAPDGASATEIANERGVPALFSWADFDRDGRLDLAAVSSQGKLRLLVNAGEGRFEDVTERAGLSGVENAAFTSWADYDGDGRIDLFVGAREGNSRLFHNEGGVFVDMSAGSGLASALASKAVQAAHWLDHDGDGRLDLHLVTADKNKLFRGLEGGFFELSELPLVDVVSAPAPVGSRVNTELGASGEDTGKLGTGTAGLDGFKVSGDRVSSGPTPGGVTPLGHFPLACASSIKDQANPGSCIEASSTPTLGRLYPLSTNLFVTALGSVGIGTTSPAARLHVAGTTRMAGPVTLDPGTDQALNVNTGSIYKGGIRFIHTRGGVNNTALGQGALSSVTVGTFNTASGSNALSANTAGYSNTASGTSALSANTTGFNNTAVGTLALPANTTGSRNTAIGTLAISANTTGSRNTAVGTLALSANTAGNDNTACGYHALYSNVAGTNTACGSNALRSNTTGGENIALGFYAGSNLTTGSYNITIGNLGVPGEASTIRIGSLQNRTFIDGIRGVTTGNANAIPVLIDSAGQLGTASSSRRFKKEIRDMGDLTERLLELRPVVFRYKEEQKVESGEVPLEYGLIAEEVAEVFPDLVVYDEEGEPFTVRYHLLSSMLLNELQKQAREMEDLRSRLSALEARGGPLALPAEIPADSR